MARMMAVMMLAGMFTAWFAGAAQAEKSSNANGQVVHTRRAPVALHRAFPPYSGVHVYAKGEGGGGGGRRGR